MITLSSDNLNENSVNPVGSCAGRRCTPTMARLYLDQGYIEEAIHIWKALMAREPAEAAHSKALADACRKRLTAETRRLSPLFRQWFYLLLQSRNT